MLFPRGHAGKSLWRQLGQSMAEYTVVIAALVGGLLVANKGACPDDYEDCIEYLLTVMHNSYDGYSASISSVHEYATDYEVADGGGGWGNGDGGGDDGGGSAGGGGDPAPTVGLTQTTVLTANAGLSNLGVYDASTGLVTQNGEVVGTYSEDTGTFTSSGGSVTTNVVSQDVVIDEDGNILQRRAVTNCSTGEVYAFGYESQTDGQFYDSLQLNEMDVGSLCTTASYRVTARDGSEDGGRIVDGLYYASSQTPVLSSSSIEPTGEVVYWDFDPPATGICAVMVVGWDDGLEESGVDLDDEEEVYAAQLALFSEPNPSENPVLGNQNAEHYAEQVFINGETASENDCVSSRTISVPG